MQFWATPPVDGCLQPEMVHPADFAYRLPEQLLLEEGALIEPFAVAVHAVTKAGLAPGDVVVVVGAGTIGVLTAITAAPSGASRVYILDVAPEKFAKIEAYPIIHTVDVSRQDLDEAVRETTRVWGADVVIEGRGNPHLFGGLWAIPAPPGPGIHRAAREGEDRPGHRASRRSRGAPHATRSPPPPGPAPGRRHGRARTPRIPGGLRAPAGIGPTAGRPPAPHHLTRDQQHTR